MHTSPELKNPTPRTMAQPIQLTLEVEVVGHRVIHVLRLGCVFSRKILEPISQLECVVHILRMILRLPARIRVSGGERRQWPSARPCEAWPVESSGAESRSLDDNDEVAGTDASSRP